MDSIAIFIAGFLCGVVFIGLLLYLVPGDGKVEDDTVRDWSKKKP